MLAVAAVAGFGFGRDEREEPLGAERVVARVVDGDTLELRGGDSVRLVQIDAPEMREDECYAEESRAELVSLAPPGARVRLETEPRTYAYGADANTLDLDKVDRYGRLLAYVVRDGENVNLELVRRGAATPWFFDGVRGRYADDLMAAARRSRAERTGLWRACPRTKLDPSGALETR